MTDREQTDELSLDSPAHLAAAVAARVRWEMELGCPGYSRWAGPVETPAAPQAPVSDATVVQAAPAPGPVSVSGPAKEVSPAKNRVSAVRPEDAGALARLEFQLRVCTECNRSSARRGIVFSDGTMTARLMFVGDAPGQEDDLTGVPFVGPAGTLLNRIIGAMGLRREDVYLCHLIKCGSGTPTVPVPAEITTCGAYLMQQIEIVRPIVIVSLGTIATRFLTGRKESIEELRGRFYELNGIQVMPTFHPREVLQDATLKRPVWEDMKQVMELLARKETRET